MEVIITPDHVTLSKPLYLQMPTINETGRLTSEEWQTLHDMINAEQIMVIDDDLNEEYNSLKRKLRALEEEDNALTALQELDEIDQNPSLEVV